MKAFLLGMIVAVAVLAGGVYFYFRMGLAPVATWAPPMPFETALAKMDLNARIRREMPATVPIPADETNLVAGAGVYAANCAVCHGLPGQRRTNIAVGMFPYPPDLLGKDPVTDDPPGETYWKVSNGIRLSGMPGFMQTLSATQMWQVSLLLKNADQLPPAAKSALSQNAAAPTN